MKKKRSLRFSLFVLFLIVMSNYVAQIPYGIHLYHGHFNPVGVVMLLLTLAWFLAGFILFLKKTKIGFWLLLSFLSVEFLFYFHGQVVLAFFGYGLFYHLIRMQDAILWWVFFIGDVNFFAAGYYIYYLWTKRDLP
jgi:hypothetical protein